jgi:hypothetical protein
MFEFDMVALHLGISNLMEFLLQRLVELLPRWYHAFQGNPIGNPPLGGLIYMCVCVCI